MKPSPSGAALAGEEGGPWSATTLPAYPAFKGPGALCSVLSLLPSVARDEGWVLVYRQEHLLHLASVQ